MTDEERAEADRRTDKICTSLKRLIDSKFTIERELRRNVTTQQMLAMALQALVAHSKETLELMHAVNLLAQRAVEEKRGDPTK